MQFAFVLFHGLYFFLFGLLLCLLQLFYFQKCLLKDFQFLFVLFLIDFLQEPLKLLLEGLGLSGILHSFRELELTDCNTAFVV